VKPATFRRLRVFHKLGASKNGVLVMLSTRGVLQIIRMLFHFSNHNIVAAIFLFKQHMKWTMSVGKNCIIVTREIE